MPESVDDLRQATNAVFIQVMAVYGVIMLCAYLVSRLTPGFSASFLASSVAAWIVIGWCQFALFNALHEALHMRFGAPHRERLAYLLAAYPVGFDERYRRVHLDHHRYFGNPELDPDYPNYGDFPKSKRSFLARLFLNLCGVLAILQFVGVRQSSPDDRADDGAAATAMLLRMLAVQATLLIAFSLTLGWFYYFWLWLLPIVTAGKFFSSTRAFCEHGSPDNRPTIRTITGSFLGEKILGVFCFHYHAEHHLYVGIPYNQLQQAHRLIGGTLYSMKPDGQPRYEHYERGYFHLMLDWFRQLPF